ncbi:hypothetical protein BU26DRAFT_1027 [Trematosphaeria pertusa]|uniref:Pentatricopeptide repeat protein n=1 Tax=Trematosphaeria pertusa TaxID=390896 RepID=A0A6A6J217_9PLEO|nr:uncharacterized protein BU26DRAFT_1027 [Trematosphaeria pertusa]KAF2255513.1 hypothetical protein BU26DRAFT_1027 [Trematosphaeria pertusa]
MLALWSRAARNPGTCRCISCVSNASAVGSRAGVAVKGPWAFGTPTSTFFYTAIFAAGIAIDATVKRNRNEQWDAAFALLREEMSQPATRRRKQLVDDEQHHSMGSADFRPVEELFPEGVPWDIIYRSSGTQLVDDRASHNLQSDFDLEHISESLWGLLPFDSRFPGTPALEWPANSGRDLVKHYLPPQSLWSPEHMRWTAIRKRQTWKKLAIQELSVGMLIYALLEHANVSRLPQDALASLSPHIRTVALLDERSNKSSRREILETVEKLQALPVDASAEQITNAKVHPNRPAIPQYYQDSDGDYHHICQQMNTAIKYLLKGSEDPVKNDDQVAAAAAKLCHNLLVSSAAPDLQTFNILISGFKRWRRPNLIDDVIAALYACKIRPNEITCAAILDHFIQTNRPDSFSRFVAKMRGADDALMLANPEITINEKGQDRLIRVNETKVYQKVHPTPMVFNALMLGVLKFAGFERALEIYYEMKEDGWGLDVLGLAHFLDDCINRVDWHGGLFIWEEISSIRRRVQPSHMAIAYSKMLSLCSVTGNTVAFNRVLNEVVRRGFDRQRVLRSAMKLTHIAQNKPDSLAPAWTADNLLIAVSGYVGDGTSSEPEGGPLEGADPFQPMPESEATKSEDPIFKDPDETWATWMEHELGEPLRKSP